MTDVLSGPAEIVNDKCIVPDGSRLDGNVWTIDTLAANGTTATLTLVVRTTAAGKVSNNVTAKSDENETNVTDGTPVEEVLPDVKLEIVKYLDVVGPYYTGDNFTFLINITNNGISNATNIVVSDVLDDAFGYVESDGDWDTNTRLVVWTINQINAGETVQVYVKVTALTNGTFNNTASGYSDENQTITEGTVSVTILPDVKLDIVKVVFSSDEIAVGDNFAFIVIITNNGLSNATNVVVSDVLDDAFGYVESDGDWDANSRLVVWTIDRIDAGKRSFVYVIVSALDYGTFNNTAVAYCDENKTIIEDTVNVTVIPNVELDIVKEVISSGDVAVGDNITFVVTVTNNGLSNATNVVVSDVLDDAFGYVESNGHWDTNTHSIVWTIDQINAGESAQVYVIVRALDYGTFNNTAVGNSDENKTTTEDTVNVTVIPNVELDIVKEVISSGDIAVGDYITFVVTVTNSGLSNATNVVVSDVLDDAFGYVESNGHWDTNTRSVWTIDQINAGESAQVYVVVRALDYGTFNNTAVGNSDENQTTTEDTVNVTVIPNVELEVVKEMITVGDVAVGDNLTFFITVTNHGLSNATNVVVSDVLDDAFGYVESNGHWDTNTRRDY